MTLAHQADVVSFPSCAHAQGHGSVVVRCVSNGIGTSEAASVASAILNRQREARKWWPYSERSASTGSTRVARRAGSQQARNDTSASPSVTAPNVSASNGLTP